MLKCQLLVALYSKYTSPLTFCEFATGTYGKAAGVPAWQGFVGGFLMIFGSRIGSGCTSGHGLSGMALLILKSIVAVPAMFLGGIILGFAFQGVDPAGYTGFAYNAASLAHAHAQAHV